MKDIFKISYKELTSKKGFYVWNLVSNIDMDLKWDFIDYYIGVHEDDGGLSYFSLWYKADIDSLMFFTSKIYSYEHLKEIKTLIKNLNEYIIQTSIRVPINTEYYYIDYDFTVEKEVEYDSIDDRHRHSTGNYFLTWDIANFYLKKIKGILSKETEESNSKRVDFMETYYFVGEYFKAYPIVEFEDYKDISNLNNNNYFMSENSAVKCSNEIKQLLNSRVSQNKTK